MPHSSSYDEISLRLPAVLDAGSAPEAHAQVLVALDAVESSDTVAVLKLDIDGNDVSPLCLQLLVSARRTFPEGRLSFGDHAAAALASIARPQEI